MRSNRKLSYVGAAVLLAAALMTSAHADEPGVAASSTSPAVCGTQDSPESGIQGDAAPAGGANCGLSLLAEVPGGGAVQGSGHCAYVRTGAGINVLDMTDPTAPRHIGTLPVFTPADGSGSETMRAITIDEHEHKSRGVGSRAVLVSGSGVYDIRQCHKPVVKGQIDWPGVLPWPASASHDVRVSHDGTKVYAGLFVVEADITELDDPSTWTVRNHTCGVAAQYHPVHMVPAAAGLSLCEDLPVDWEFGPQLSHGPDDNGDGTRLFVGSQTAAATFWAEDDTLRILDMTTDPPTIKATAHGPGHSIDWFRTADGREWLLHANEIVAAPATSCVPEGIRPSSLGWAHDAFLTEVTGDQLRRAATAGLAINRSENCQAKLASNQNTGVAYHAVDDPYDAHFAMVSMGDAGFRVFDIRNPDSPSEVAYFNRGPLVHAGVGHYDAARGLIYIPAATGMQVLEVQPRVYDALDLPYPSDPAWPRYPDGRAATPSS
jgi:hypothetical protein